MRCPSCAAEVEVGAWFCPVCAHQLEEGAAAPPAEREVASDTTFVDEVSRSVAWEGSADVTAEALIVGELSEDSGPAHTFHGAVPHEDGSTPSVRLYSTADARLDDPTQAPRRTRRVADADLTPYEQFVYEEVDGTRTLGEIQSAGLLAPAEIQVSLLTLIERGLVSLTPPPAPAPLPTLDPSFLVAIEDTPVPPARPSPHLDLASDLASDLAGYVASARPAVRPSVRPAPRTSVPVGGDPPENALAAVGVGLRTNAPSVVPASLPPGLPPALPELAPRARTGLPAATGDLVRPRPSAPAPAARRSHAAPPVGAPEVRVDKARELFAAAMIDRGTGHVVSARMNLKLAIAFDPDNVSYQDAYAQLGQVRQASPMGEGILHPAAQRAFDDGCAAEATGDIERATKLWEAALRHGDDPMIMNRLGVVLATQRGDWKRGHQLLMRAVELAPMNPVYTHNLSKVVSLAHKEGRSPVNSGFWKRMFQR